MLRQERTISKFFLYFGAFITLVTFSNRADANPAFLLQQGMVVKTSTPEQLATQIKSDLARWKKVVGDAGIAAD